MTDGDFHRRRLDRFDAPSFRETGADLVLRHPSRPEGSWLAVAEAEHDVAAARGEHRPEALDVPCPIIVVEHVEEAAVEDRVVALSQGGQVEGVADDEADPQPPLARFCLGTGDRRRRRVEPGGLQAQARSQERVLTGAAPRIEHLPAQPAGAGELGEGGLRPSDLPWGRACICIERVELLPARGLARGGLGVEAPGQPFEPGGDQAHLARILGAERRREGAIDGGGGTVCGTGKDLGRRPYDGAAAICGIGDGHEGPLGAQPCDRGGHVALRESRPGGDLTNRAVRVLDDVDEDRPDAGGKFMEPGPVDCVLADLHQGPAQPEELDAVHHSEYIKADASLWITWETAVNRPRLRCYYRVGSRRWADDSFQTNRRVP